MQMSTAMDAYSRVRAQEGFSAHTLNLYQTHMRKLIEDVGDLELNEVTLDTFRDHLAKQSHLKLSSIASKVRALKSVFKWLWEEEYIPSNPARKLKEPKQPQLMPKALTTEEVEQLRDSCETPLEHALIELFFATGCRLSEIAALNKSDIDWQRKAVTVFGKGSKEREVYFGAKCRIWLKRYLTSRTGSEVAQDALFVTPSRPHNRLSNHRIWDIFKAIASRCGLEHKVSPHTLRHTLATTLLNQGAPLEVVRSLLGHQKSETTLRYAVLSGEARHREYQRYFVQ